MSKIRWYRSDDGAIAGVCKGLAEAFELDTAIVRILFIVFTIFGGVGPFMYIALIFSLPRKDKLHSALEPKVLGVCANLSERFENRGGDHPLYRRVYCLHVFGPDFFGLRGSVFSDA